MAELTSQLSAARAAEADAQARVDRIEEVRKKDIPDASVADSLRSEVIVHLRNQYLELATRAGLWAARYGSNHLAVINLRAQMDELRRAIADELGRIAESAKSDYAIARSRVVTPEQNMARLVAKTQIADSDRIGLRELESKAQVYHTIYDNFLQHYMEAVQQQSFPITEARVISAAKPPLQKSRPVVWLVLAVAGGVGLTMSCAVAGLRQVLDGVFRSSQQVEDTLGTNCLAVLARLEPSAGRTDGLCRRVVQDPMSPFAESLRAVKVAADIEATIRDCRIIGITSAVPGEGKSTVASNLAHLIAHGGRKVILIDGDLRNPSLTRSLAPKATVGLLEVLAGTTALADALQVDDATRLAFLPVVIESRLAHTSEILSSQPLLALAERLRKACDCVIIDFPPLAPVVDVRATSNLVDSYVLVTEWGRTRIETVRRQLAAAPAVCKRLLGVVLNKANIKVLGRYEDYQGCYREHYGRYRATA